MISHWRSEQLLPGRSRMRSGKRFTNRGLRSKWWLPAIITSCLWGWVFSQSGWAWIFAKEPDWKRSPACKSRFPFGSWGWVSEMYTMVTRFLICGNGVGERHLWIVVAMYSANYRTPIERTPSTRRQLGGALIHVWTKQSKWWYMFLLCEWESNL